MLRVKESQDRKSWVVLYDGPDRPPYIVFRGNIWACCQAVSQYERTA